MQVLIIRHAPAGDRASWSKKGKNDSIRPLTREEACMLAQTYLDHFRLDDTPPPDPLYPLTTEAIGEIHHASDGVIRKCLKAFHWAIEEGAEVGFPVIDRDFLVEHHHAITGRVYDDTL